MSAALVRPWVLPRELIALSSRYLNLPACSYSTSTPTRPRSFSFLTSYSFHGKPELPEPPSTPDSPVQQPPKLLQGFSSDSPIARWRDAVLAERPWGAGHDWLFVKEHEGVTFLGIADGVGGWDSSGIDPSHFSQAFLYWCERAVEEGFKDPREIMWKGYHGVRQEKDVIAGSSTACILALEADGSMTAANLGDSTFLIIRDGQVLHTQPSQTHFFNAPRQITKLPAGTSPKGWLIDSPDDADTFTSQLQDGDIVLVATDGFSDNVWPAETQELIKLVRGVQESQGLTDQEMIDRMASASVNYARLCSVKENKESPFEVEARRYRKIYRGGKVDDCLVVVALVKATS